MENEKLTSHRLNAIERALEVQEKNINVIETDIKKLNQRTNDRYSEISNLSSRLEENYKNQSNTVNRLLTSIDSLVSEMKETNKTYNEQFKTIDNKLGKLENKVTSLPFSNQTFPKTQSNTSVQETTSNDDGTKLGTLSKGAITIGIIGLLETFIRYVAPLLVN